MSGPPPKPTELRVLEGNPSKRAIKPTIRCHPMALDPPDILGDVGRAEWQRIVDTVGGVPGLLQEQDRPAMTALCMTWEQFLSASEIVQRSGVLVKSQGRQADRAAAIRNPAMQVARDCLTSLLSLWQRFGMTPSDRARLEAPKADDQDNPLAELLAESKKEAASRRGKG